jgi:hypothetical protein
VLITPGAHFGIGRYIRIGYGYDVGKTLERLAQLLLDTSRQTAGDKKDGRWRGVDGLCAENMRAAEGAGIVLTCTDLTSAAACDPAHTAPVTC